MNLYACPRCAGTLVSYRTTLARWLACLACKFTRPIALAAALLLVSGACTHIVALPAAPAPRAERPYLRLENPAPDDTLVDLVRLFTGCDLYAYHVRGDPAPRVALRKCVPAVAPVRPSEPGV